MCIYNRRVHGLGSWPTRNEIDSRSRKGTQIESEVSCYIGSGVNIIRSVMFIKSVYMFCIFWSVQGIDWSDTSVHEVDWNNVPDNEERLYADDNLIENIP